MTFVSDHTGSTTAVPTRFAEGVEEEGEGVPPIHSRQDHTAITLKIGDGVHVTTTYSRDALLWRRCLPPARCYTLGRRVLF